PSREVSGVGRFRGAGDDPARLQLRIIIHTGPVILGLSGELGPHAQTQDTFHFAQSLLQSAPGGAIVISHDTHCQLRDLFETAPLELLPAAAGGASTPSYRVHRAKPRVF